MAAVKNKAEHGWRRRAYEMTYIKTVLVLVLAIAAGSALALWRLGVPPICAGLVAVNAVTLFLYGYDKRQATVAGTRIPEAVLHIITLLGGSPAALLGQGLFRHKTRKRSFRLAFACIVLIQGILLYGYWRFLRG